MEAVIKDFLNSAEQKLCVLSTVDNENKPESAVMAYALENGLSLILSTHNDSRKWKNIEKNPNVSLVFGWDFANYNIQFEGVAELISDNEEIERVYFSANPKLVKFRDLPGMAFIRIKPTWIRLTDHSVEPPKIQEKSY